MSMLRTLPLLLVLLDAGALPSAGVVTEPQRLAQGEWRIVTGGASLRVDNPQAKNASLILIEDRPSQTAGSSRHDFTLHISEGPECKRRMDPIWFFSPDDNFNLAFVDLTGDGIDELVTYGRAGQSWEPKREILNVRQWCGSQIGLLLSVEVSGESEGGSWRYDSSFKDLNGDGTLDLLLVRIKASAEPPKTGLPPFPPSGSRGGYVYDPKAGVMNPVPEAVLQSSRRP